MGAGNSQMNDLTIIQTTQVMQHQVLISVYYFNLTQMTTLQARYLPYEVELCVLK